MVSAFALDKGLDFLTGGKLNKYSRKAAIKIVKTTLPIALRVGGSVGVSTARAALPLVTNPYLAGTALGLGALQTEPGTRIIGSSRRAWQNGPYKIRTSFNRSRSRGGKSEV